jgi:FkbM family methyltransferase
MRWMLNHLRKTKHYVESFGSRHGTMLLAHEAYTTATHEVTINGGLLPLPLTLRTHSSDIATFRKVMTEREYEIPDLPAPRTIIDAGANIGLASIFFASRFPAARIIALEPEPINFELLQRNASRYPNITCVQKALWSQSGTINIFDPGDGAWSFRIEAEGHQEGARRVGSVECVNMADLMSEFGLAHVDLLKIDIEGSEKEVFEACTGWIDHVDAIAIELHDRFKRGCSLAFYRATAGFAHEIHKGENVFVLRGATHH